ncbi:hypothetical protein HOY82DRAFT_539110 [Tuber indicum]|nr:hypothetical protein HOY82DRAFT_539110 [Tuber indicum]
MLALFSLPTPLLKIPIPLGAAPIPKATCIGAHPLTGSFHLMGFLQAVVIPCVLRLVLAVCPGLWCIDFLKNGFKDTHWQKRRLRSSRQCARSGHLPDPLDFANFFHPLAVGEEDGGMGYVYGVLESRGLRKADGAQTQHPIPFFDV